MLQIDFCIVSNSPFVFSLILYVSDLILSYLMSSNLISDDVISHKRLVYCDLIHMIFIPELAFCMLFQNIANSWYSS